MPRRSGYSRKPAPGVAFGNPWDAGRVVCAQSNPLSGGNWRIRSLYKPKAGLTGDDAAPAAPTDAELAALVKGALHEFALSANAKDFSGFHKYISHLWQTQITVEKLNDVFKPFMGIDLLVRRDPAGGLRSLHRVRSPSNWCVTRSTLEAGLQAPFPASLNREPAIGTNSHA